MADASHAPESGRGGDPGRAPLPPGPDELPLVGSTLSLMRDPIGFIDDVSAHGDVVTYRLAGQRFTAVLHPEHVEQVLVRDSERFRRWTAEEWGSAFGGVGEQGLVLTDGEQWRRQRLLIQQAFTPARIEAYADAMVDEAERTVAGWRDGDVVDLQDELSSLTLSVIARTLFDLDVEGRGDVVRRAAPLLNARANAQNLRTFLPNWLPLPANRRFDRTMAELEELVHELIEERRSDAATRDDLLSLLLTTETDDGETLTDAEVRDQLVTFLFAGHETTSLALTYALHALGHHPEQLDRLRREVEQVTGGRPPALADLPELTDTERVVTETLRLYPPSYALFREATEDAVVGGYRVPAGSKLTVPQIHVHRDDRWFDDPASFRPERWTAAFEDELPEYAYFPFGGGPRHCIGMRFATMELRLVLATLVSALEAVEPLTDRELSFDTGITLQPADPVEARVRLRDTSR